MTPPSAADRPLGAERTVDEGRAAVAEAEENAFGGTDLDVALGRAELEDRLAAVVTASWWAESGPPVRVVTPRRTTRSSTARTTQGDEHVEVRLSDEQLTLGTVAHELAHALAGVADGHGGLFRAAYVDVTAVLAGAEQATRLAAALTAFGAPPGERAWPAPWRAEGPTFRVVP